MAGLTGYGWKWLDISGYGLKWDGLIKVLGIWVVWEMEIWGLGDFKLGLAQPGLLD